MNMSNCLFFRHFYSPLSPSFPHANSRYPSLAHSHTLTPTHTHTLTHTISIHLPLSLTILLSLSHTPQVADMLPAKKQRYKSTITTLDAKEKTVTLHDGSKIQYNKVT